jgi:hypothetical protein
MKRKFQLAIVLLVGNLLWVNDMIAQGCAMCTATAGNLDESSAKGLNYGIIYLGLIPLVLILTVFYKWYKANNQNTDV